MDIFLVDLIVKNDRYNSCNLSVNKQEICDPSEETHERDCKQQ
jgi:hypothetical protein